MPATVTLLEREIADEERVVGMPANRPLTDGAIARRRSQIAIVLGSSGFVAMSSLFFAAGLVRVGAIALALLFGGYAIGKDRHLRRLALLRGDSMRITLAVANELMSSGALTGARELLDLREGIDRAAGRLAAGLADVVPADCTRLRVVGPSGEVPVAAERELGSRNDVADDRTAAEQAVESHKSVRRITTDDRGVLVVALQHGDDIVALLEAVAPSGDRFRPGDLARAEAFARGAVSALVATG
jgi:hypothetical protein